MRESMLPMDEEEADERLLNVVKHYVCEREMPIYVAKNVLRCNLRDKSCFEIKWEKFINLIGGYATK
jgi:hypothetical protein